MATQAPNQTSQTHAEHYFCPVTQTLEVIHILRGALYEQRLTGATIPRQTDPEAREGPDLSKATGLHFTRGCFSAGNIYVNEVGSIHQSFTRGEGCLLLCVWGGAHLNLPPSHWPPGYDPNDV